MTEKPDLPTLVAIAVVAYALANVAHEGLGHGGACLAVGGHARSLSAIHFDCAEEGLAPAAVRWLAAGGTLVNLLIGGLAWLGLRAGGPSPTPGRYFLWLLMAVNLLQAAGYWLFSGLGNVGDWAGVIAGWSPRWAWRGGLAVVGGAAYWGVVHLALRELLPFLGGEEQRERRARTLVVVPYLAGGVLYVAAGLLNPLGWRLVVISAAAASFGGTSGFAWMTELLHDKASFPPSNCPALRVVRSWAWLAAGTATAVVFVLVLGPAVRF